MINVTALSSSYLIVADQLNLNRPSFGPIEQGSFLLQEAMRKSIPVS